MKKQLFLLINCLLLPLVIITSAAQASLKSDLDRLVQSAKPPVHVGIVVRQATTGAILYASEGLSLFSPASVQKLITATAALLGLGKDFRFKTELRTNGKVMDGVLHGDLVVKFSGDPELTIDHLNQLIGTLASRGIKKIDGRLYLDKSIYDDISYPPGWLWDDLSYSYAAPLSAVNLNKNKFFLHLAPAARIGAPPTLAISLPSTIIHVTNRAVTTAKYNKNCPLTIYSDYSNHFTVYGCIPKSQTQWGRSLALRNPVPYAALLIQRFLTQHGIVHEGGVIVGNASHANHILSVHDSVPLEEMLKHMLKKSDNLISDSLMKQLGYQQLHQQGSWGSGKAAIEQLLGKYIGLNFQKALIDDGAGMSRYNLLTPMLLTTVLDFIYKQPDAFRRVLMEALPLAGVDGTLIGRMYPMAAQKRVRAKTGTMTGVSALTGFIDTQNLGVLTFAIITNGFIGKGRPYKYLEDRICEHLATFHGTVNG